MSKGINKFLDLMKLNENDDDYDDDDLFDDDYDEEEERPSRNLFSKKEKPQRAVKEESAITSNPYAEKRAQKTSHTSRQSGGKLIPLNNRGGAEIYVIKPQEFNEAQVVADFLKDGKTIVINMEGIEIYSAQRIIDFISGACYALNGSLQAISNNIFIAAPEAIEVSGDLREEILNDNMLAPDLGKYRV